MDDLSLGILWNQPKINLAAARQNPKSLRV